LLLPLPHKINENKVLRTAPQKKSKESP
jgi:hypothetical protein